MRRSLLFPRPELMSALDALVAICRLRAILRGDLRLGPWRDAA